MKKRLSIYPFLIVCLTFFFASCSTKVYYSQLAEANRKAEERPEKPYHSVYLMGDAGEIKNLDGEPNFRLLQHMLEQDSASSLLVLGDNVYDYGLPPEGHPRRSDYEKKIISQMNIVKNHKGKIFFVPGNHDWDRMGPEGWDRVKYQEQFVESYLNRGNTWIPDKGCPGPYLVDLAENLVLLAFDSQWWLHRHAKPYGPNSGCDAGDEKAFLRRMAQLVEANKHKHIIVGAHHPFVSNSNHGGYYSVMDHLFPLRLVRDKLYVPLPVIGSIYPFYRQYGGVDQDIPHPRAQELIVELMKIFNKYDNIVYTSGHDHNMQLHRLQKVIHILSGSGVKTNPVKAGDGAEFVVKSTGFVRLLYYPDSEVWAEFWSPEGDGSSGTVWYRTKLYTRRPLTDDQNCANSAPSLKDSVVVTSPAEVERQSARWNLFIGRNYTSEWNKKIKIPVLDLKNFEGGLIPYSIGGSAYRRGLRFKTVSGKEYLASPVQRHPFKLLPTDYYGSWSTGEKTRTRITLQHPYAPLIVPELHDRAGNLTNMPRLAILPEAACMGQYQKLFSNSMVFMEQRAENNHTERLESGQSYRIVNYEEMLTEHESHPLKIFDSKDFAQVRLIDMLVGDWDRTPDKYHWAAVPDGNKTVYRTIGTDYENAFFSATGLLSRLLSSRIFVRHWEHFTGSINDLKGLNNSARNMDRRLLHSLSRKDWEEIAAGLQNKLTDEALERSVKRMPAEVYGISGNEILAALKQRRNDLVHTAREYYSILAQYVNVYGSGLNDRFIIRGTSPQQVRVQVYTISPETQQEVLTFSRDVHVAETKELRLYGLEGKNQYSFTGSISKRLKIRLIPGAEAAMIHDTAGHVITYDPKNRYEVDPTPETNLDYSLHNIVSYNTGDPFFYNQAAPFGYANYNSSDGVVLGAGILYRRYHFRQQPYGSEHRLLYQKSLSNSLGRLYYKGDVKLVFKEFSLMTDAWMHVPNYLFAYRGFGNETLKDSAAILRVQSLQINSLFYQSFGTFFRWGVGPGLQIVKNLDHQNIYRQNTRENDTAGTQQYLSIRGVFQFGIKNNYANPARGLLMRFESQLNQHLSDNSRYTKSSLEVAYYMSPDLPFQLTFAGRLAGAFNTGTYSFFQGNMLTGGLSPEFTQNLRGYGRTRFVGDRNLFYNLELRSELFKFNIAPFSAQFGVLALKDAGRVWVRNEKSDKWHHSAGGGIWTSIMNRFVVSATAVRSAEGTFYYVNNSFFF